MTAARATTKRKVASRPLPVVQPGGVVVHADANTLPAATCHLSHCSEPPAPGAPTLLCADHHDAARRAPMLRDATGVEWGACLRGCAGMCELGKWRAEGGSREFQRPKEGCEHLPAHMIHLAQGTLRRRVFVNDE